MHTSSIPVDNEYIKFTDLYKKIKKLIISLIEMHLNVLLPTVEPPKNDQSLLFKIDNQTEVRDDFYCLNVPHIKLIFAK